MPFRRRHIVFFGAAVAPFVALPIGLTWSVPHLARTSAQLLHLFANDLSLDSRFRATPTVAEENGGTASTDSGESAEPGSSETTATPTPTPEDGASNRERHVTAERTLNAPNATPKAAAARRAAATPTPRTRASVFVGADSVLRAIPSTGRPTSAWTNRTAQHPAGLLIQSPGALRGVIQAGDILVEAEGQALNSFEQLIVTVKQAYERRATRLYGRIFRNGDLVPVTVEPGWQ